MSRCRYCLYHLLVTVLAVILHNTLALASGVRYCMPVIPLMTGRIGIVGYINITALGARVCREALCCTARSSDLFSVIMLCKRCEVCNIAVVAVNASMFRIAVHCAGRSYCICRVAVVCHGRCLRIVAAALFAHMQF